MLAAIISKATAKSDEEYIARNEDENPGLSEKNKKYQLKFVRLHFYTFSTILFNKKTFHCS